MTPIRGGKLCVLYLSVFAPSFGFRRGNSEKTGYLMKSVTRHEDVFARFVNNMERPKLS